jgi:hypothetical protein
MFRWWFLPLDMQRFGAAVRGNGCGSGLCNYTTIFGLNFASLKLCVLDITPGNELLVFCSLLQISRSGNVIEQANKNE